MEGQPYPHQQPQLQKPPGYRGQQVSTPTPPTPPARPAHRRQNLPPVFNKRRRRRGCCRCCCYCCCCTIFILIILAAVSAAATGIFYLWFHPSLPTFHLQSLRFQDFNVSVGPDGSFLNSKADIRVQATNRNEKIKIWYEPVQCRLMTGDREENKLSLGDQSYFPAFSQGYRNITVMKFSPEVKAVAVDDQEAGTLMKDYKAKKLGLEIEFQTSVGAEIGQWKTAMLNVKLVCGRVTVAQMADGQTPKCNINIFKWITLS